MRAGSFRKYLATHNPVRLFPEELKRTFKYCEYEHRHAKSISKHKAQIINHDYPASKSMFAHTLCELSCLSWFELDRPF